MTRASRFDGRERHVVSDTNGRLVGAQVHSADIQDRDGAPDLLASIRYLFPWLRHVLADGAYAGGNWRPRLPGAGSGRWRSSSDQTKPKGLKYCPGAGWSK